MAERLESDRWEATPMERRRFLKWAAAAPLAASAAGVLAACGAEDEGRQAEPALPPDPATIPTEPAPAPEPTPAPTPEPAPPAAGGGGNPADALVTELDSMQSTVQALQYVNQSAKTDQNCTNCQFYSAGSDGRGKCQLFVEGLVRSEGWCASWTKKVTG